MYVNADPKHNSHSWRDAVTQCIVLDVFYDPLDEKAKQFAKDWAEENDKEASGKAAGLMSDYRRNDRRYFWASFGTSDDPHQGTILDSVWNKYFDSRWGYLKSLLIDKLQFCQGEV